MFVTTSYVPQIMPFVDTTFATISKRTKKTEEKKSEVKVPEKILLTHLRAVLRQFKLGKTIKDKKKA